MRHAFCFFSDVTAAARLALLLMMASCEYTGVQAHTENGKVSECAKTLFNFEGHLLQYSVKYTVTSVNVVHTRQTGIYPQDQSCPARVRYVMETINAGNAAPLTTNNGDNLFIACHDTTTNDLYLYVDHYVMFQGMPYIRLRTKEGEKMDTQAVLSTYLEVLDVGDSPLEFRMQRDEDEITTTFKAWEVTRTEDRTTARRMPATDALTLVGAAEVVDKDLGTSTTLINIRQTLPADDLNELSVVFSWFVEDSFRHDVRFVTARGEPRPLRTEVYGTHVE